MPDDNKGGNATPVLTREFVPQEFQDRPYLKDFLDKPWEKGTAAEIFKKLDGAESLLGKRPQIPDFKTARPEDVLKFFEQARPEKIDDYEIKVGEGVKPDEAVLKAVRQAFHDGAISKAQAAKFLASMDPFWASQREKAVQEKQRRDAEFDALSKSVLGDGNKAVIERVKKLFADLAPAAVKMNWDKVSNENLVALIAVADAIHKKYAPEDELGKGGRGGGNGAGGSGGTIEEKRTEMRTIMQSKEYGNWQAPGHEQALSRVRQLAQEMSDLQGGK